ERHAQRGDFERVRVGDHAADDHRAAARHGRQLLEEEAASVAFGDRERHAARRELSDQVLHILSLRRWRHAHRHAKRHTGWASRSYASARSMPTRTIPPTGSSSALTSTNPSTSGASRYERPAYQPEPGSGRPSMSTSISWPSMPRLEA